MVHLVEDFYIDSDPNNYILRQKMVIKNKESKNYGQETFKDLGYYTDLETLLKGFVKFKGREFCMKKNKEIKDLIEEIRKQQKFIEELNLKV